MTVDPHRLTLTAYPEVPGPYDRWEMTQDSTGKLIASGAMPVDWNAVRPIIDEFHRSVDAAAG
jgi:hypothetical protein